SPGPSPPMRRPRNGRPTTRSSCSPDACARMQAMRILETKAELRGALTPTRRAGGTVGLVPTMGYLHDGHVSHMTRSAGENDLTVATIFVNPLQFAANEDLSTYPRDP